MTAVGASVNTFSSSNIALTSRCNDTGYAYDLTNQVTLEISDHDRVLITVNLQLEFWTWFHFRVAFVIIVNFINSFNGSLEDFDVLGRLISERSVKLLIECIEVSDVDSQVVMSSLSIPSHLLPVNKLVSNLGLSDEMHEFILSLRKRWTVLAAIHGLVDQVLVCVVDLISLEHLNMVFIKF